jgi:precorrin-6A/cobalt-precorrin-6A reductase
MMLIQGLSMRTHLLILAGTTEATDLAKLVAEANIPATLSYAGRVKRTKPQPLPKRIGGYGGAQGLAEYLLAEKVTNVIDATHPFASQMSSNAIKACSETGTQLCALTRPAWTSVDGDQWHHVPTIGKAGEYLQGLDETNVMLAIGRMHLAEFSCAPQHQYLLRLVDQTETLPLPKATALYSRGPFSTQDDIALMLEHNIKLLVSKNAGGLGTYSKIAAARHLGIPVVMIDRPAIPKRVEVHTPKDALKWVHHTSNS